MWIWRGSEDVFHVVVQDGTCVAVDPTLKEEATMSGQLTCVLNKQQELCSIQKRGGVGIAAEMVEHCISVSSQKVVELTEQLEAALARHSTARVQARIRKHASVPAGVPPAAGDPPTTGRAQWRAAAIEMRKMEAVDALATVALVKEESSSSEEEIDEDVRGVEEMEASPRAGEEGDSGDGEDISAQLPTGGLLMPAVVTTAGLAGNARSAEKGKPTGSALKKSKKAAGKRRVKVEDEYVQDDFADIAAVIAGAAAKGGRTEGLKGAVKPKEQKRK
jgi:hypothetical protein